MNSIVVICLVVFAVIAVTSGQDSLMQMMMMQNMMRGNRANNRPQQPGSKSYNVGQGSGTQGGGGQTGFGGGGMNMFALSQMGDTARGMVLCNMYTGQMRMMCMMGMI